MGILAYLANHTNGDYIYSCKPIDQFIEPITGREYLITFDALHAHGLYKTTTIVASGTVTVVLAPPGGSILITDIVMNADKSANSTITLEWNDGTVQDELLSAQLGNQNFQMVWSVTGRVQGWEDARLDILTSGTFNASINIGYIRMPAGDKKGTWDILKG